MIDRPVFQAKGEETRAMMIFSFQQCVIIIQCRQNNYLIVSGTEALSTDRNHPNYPLSPLQHTQTYTQTHICILIHTHTHTHAYSNTHACTHTRFHKYTHTCIHICIHAYIYTHTHTHTHTHTKK